MTRRPGVVRKTWSTLATACRTLAHWQEFLFPLRFVAWATLLWFVVDLGLVKPFIGALQSGTSRLVVGSAPTREVFPTHPLCVCTRQRCGSMGCSRKGPFVRIAVTIRGLLLVLLVLAVPLAAASGHVQTTTIDPTPGMPASGDEVTVTIQGEDTAQGRGDVANVKTQFDATIAGSATMKNEAVTAGGATKAFTIQVKRGPDVEIGRENEVGSITVDPGDTGRAGTFLTGGAAADRTTVANGFLKAVLAHEVAGLGRVNHDHGTIIPVENQILSELSLGFSRVAACRQTADTPPKTLIDYNVGTATVTLTVDPIPGPGGINEYTELPCNSPGGVPTLSQWGTIALGAALAVLGAGTVSRIRRR